MVCIYCGFQTRVSNSRPSKKTSSTWRRRECDHCKRIFTTRENVEYSSALRVRTSSGALQPFSRDKLLISLYSSLSHRKTALDDAEALTMTVIANLLNNHKAGLLDAPQIIDAAIETLSRFDNAATTHYSAHHES